MRHAQWEANMKMFKSVARAAAGLAVAGVFAISGAASAQALNFQWQITNNFGSTITLDRATCSNGGSISASFSIPSNTTVTIFGTSSSTSDLCNARYNGGAGNNFGCQFQVETDGTNGFTSTNPYKGTGSSPTCTSLNGNGASIPGGWSGQFKMQ
jgi:hypothetical protein